MACMHVLKKKVLQSFSIEKKKEQNLLARHSFGIALGGVVVFSSLSNNPREDVIFSVVALCFPEFSFDLAQVLGG